jgi:Spy/CpxP family protein refolding chaperone
MKMEHDLMKFPTIILGLSSFIFSGMTLAAETPTQPDEMNSVLNLNKQQKDQLIKYHATAAECMNNIDASKFKPRLFLEMVKNGSVDSTVFDQQMAIQNRLHDQAALCKITYYTNVSNMLTPAQKQKLVQMYKQGMQ